jgi:hypothetical protein
MQPMPNGTHDRLVPATSKPASDDMDLQIIREKIIKLRRDCGCSMGGIFLVASFILSLGYLGIIRGFSFRAVLIALGFVFVSAIIGKSIGIGIARIRLSMLCKSLHKQATRITIWQHARSGSIDS